MTYEYCVYGLRLHTNWPISWLSTAISPAASDLSIVATQIAVDNGSDDCFVGAMTERFGGVTPAFSTPVSDGIIFHFDSSWRTIHIDYASHRTLDEVSALLFGPMIGYLLRGFGKLCLHASVVALGSRAIAFVGASGKGKSTLAAAFARRGHFVLADDMAVLEVADGRIVVQPGPRFLRVCHDTASAVLCEHGWDKKARSSPLADEKLYFALSEAAAAHTPFPLAAIYVLDEDEASDEPRIERLSTTQAFIHLAQNQFPRANIAHLWHDTFAKLQQVVEQVPVHSLHRPQSLPRLEQTFQIILADATTMETPLVP